MRSASVIVMPRTRRYHQVQRESDDDQFETEALQGAQGDDPDGDSFFFFFFNSGITYLLMSVSPGEA